MSDFNGKLVWKRGYSLLLEVYETTKLFPNFEKYGLTVQARKTSVMMASSLAKYYSFRARDEKIKALYFTMAFLDELKVCFLLAKDLGYFSRDEDDYINEKGFLQKNAEANEKRSMILVNKVDDFSNLLQHMLEKNLEPIK